MKQVSFLFMFIELLCMASCKKNKPPKGDYYLILNSKIELDSGDSMLIEHKLMLSNTLV